MPTSYVHCPLRYEKPIETVQELADRGLEYWVPANTAPQLLVMSDPRPAMQLIKKRAVYYPYDGKIPQHVRDK